MRLWEKPVREREREKLRETELTPIIISTTSLSLAPMRLPVTGQKTMRKRGQSDRRHLIQFTRLSDGEVISDLVVVVGN